MLCLWLKKGNNAVPFTSSKKVAENWKYIQSLIMTIKKVKIVNEYGAGSFEQILLKFNKDINSFFIF